MIWEVGGEICLMPASIETRETAVLFWHCFFKAEHAFHSTKTEQKENLLYVYICMKMYIYMYM